MTQIKSTITFEKSFEVLFKNSFNYKLITKISKGQFRIHYENVASNYLLIILNIQAYTHTVIFNGNKALKPMNEISIFGSSESRICSFHAAVFAKCILQK